MKIYTKTGDGGQTSLYGGARVSKDNPWVEAYGTIDELNSAIGIVIADCTLADCELLNNKKIKQSLIEIQKDLFVIGTILAGNEKNCELRIENLELRVKDLEKMIDWMVDRLPRQKHFILPGGSIPSAQLHLARTICRRAERRVVSLKLSNCELKIVNCEKILNLCVIYLNRLSDFLYTLARWINYLQKTAEIEWKQSL